MRAHAFKRTRALVLVVVWAGLALSSSVAAAAPVSVDLCAVPGTATLTGAVTVPIWGFGVPSTPGDCSTATASLPGPVLTANQGDTVTVTVTNALPAGHTLSFEAPGIDFDAGPVNAAAGASVTRTFTASAPGTYLYSSGGDGGRQQAMGLYGALIVRPPTANQAYGPAATAYDVEAPLVLSAVDPALNGTADPNDFDMYQYRATYWLINGKAYPSTAPIAAAGQRVLLRYLNAGYDNTSILLLGMHERVVARDARLLNNPFDAAAETIPAGATEDAIATVPSGTPPSANGFALYNRQLHLTQRPAERPHPDPRDGGAKAAGSAVPVAWQRPAVGTAGLAERSGVRITQVAVTGDGGLIDLRYQVVEPGQGGHPARTMSVGGCNLDFQPDLRSLRAAGILPVFAAGNYGPTSGTVLSPANNLEALAVGATDDADVLDPSSSRGPSACAQAVAPKLVAPGVGVRTTDVYGLYADASGTSLAAPHVAGALALLLGAFPGIDADRQEAALESGARDWAPPAWTTTTATGAWTRSPPTSGSPVPLISPSRCPPPPPAPPRAGRSRTPCR